MQWNIVVNVDAVKKFNPFKPKTLFHSFVSVERKMSEA